MPVMFWRAGSGLQFEPRGEEELKGLPGVWATFAAHPCLWRRRRTCPLSPARCAPGSLPIGAWGTVNRAAVRGAFGLRGVWLGDPCTIGGCTAHRWCGGM